MSFWPYILDPQNNLFRSQKGLLKKGEMGGVSLASLEQVCRIQLKGLYSSWKAKSQTWIVLLYLDSTQAYEIVSTAFLKTRQLCSGASRMVVKRCSSSSPTLCFSIQNWLGTVAFCHRILEKASMLLKLQQKGSLVNLI